MIRGALSNEQPRACALTPPHQHVVRLQTPQSGMVRLFVEYCRTTARDNARDAAANDHSSRTR